MRKQAAPVAYIVLCSLLVVQVAGGQTTGLSASPKGPLVAYLETLFRPAAEGKSLAEDTLRSFYSTYLAVETRAQVSEDQFIEYWKHVPIPSRLGYDTTIGYFVSEPVQSESHDQALILATIKVAYNPSFATNVLTLVGTIVIGMGCVITPKSADSRVCKEGIDPGRWVESNQAIFRVVKEGDVWKLVLPENLTADMQKATPQAAARRYTPNSTVSESGVTVRVTRVIIEKDATTVRLSVENASGDEARLLDAFSLATLTDDSGNSYNTRILRSTLPERVAAGASVAATLVFDPVPLTAQNLSLSVLGIGMGDRQMSLKLDVVLTPLPPVVSRTPIPGEPVLMYLLTIHHPLWMVKEGRSLKAFYQTYLSIDTRIQVTEDEFVEYGKKDAAALLGQVTSSLFLGRTFKGFTISEPVYNTTKDVVSMEVTNVWEDHPLFGHVSTKTEVTTFHVAREGSTWKLALSEEAVKDIATLRSSVSVRHRLQNAETSNESVTIRVDEAILDKGFVTLHLTMKNDNDAEANLSNMIYDATLTDERGKTYPTRILRSTLPERVTPRSSDEGNLVFEAVPFNSKKWHLTAPGLRVGEKVFSLGVDLTLEP